MNIDALTQILDAINGVASRLGLFIHHFDVNLNHETLPVIPDGYRLDLNFNVMSNNGVKYEVLSDMDGDGYIIQAFGLLHNIETGDILTTSVIEGKLFYKDLYNGALLLHLSDLTNNTVSSAIAVNLNNYQLQDSVRRI